MKLAYICPFAHTTVIDKPEEVFKRVPPEIVCTHLGCGCPAGLFLASVIDESVIATHEFYEDRDSILSAEEIAYIKAGGLLFREITSAIPDSVKKEFKATHAIEKLAMYFINNFPKEERLPDIVDTVISVLKKYKGHMAVMKTLGRKNTNLN